MGAGPPPTGPQHADFEELYQRHSREVWAVVYARCLRSDAALDITQEAFLRLWRQWEQGSAILNPRAWLVRVARNLAEDHAKCAFARNGTQPPQLLNGVLSRAQLPVDDLIKKETIACLRLELRQLSETDREILTFRYALEYPIEEIAAILGVNVTAVNMRLSRARRRLAERLTAKGVMSIP